MLNKKAIAATAAGVETDEDFNQTVLLLHGDGTNGAQNNTFTDSSTNNFTITRNGNTTQGTFSPFSQTGWSNYFDGTGDYLTFTTKTFAGDFTAECWVYKTATDSSGYTVVFGDSTQNTQLSFDNSTAGAIGLVINANVVSSNAGTAVVANQWNHLAWVRQGSTCRLYVNGVQQGSGSNSSSMDLSVIGRFGSGGGYEMNGYISNARLTNACLYPDGTTFTPSTTPLTTTVSTGTVQLLTCQSNRFVDNSASPATITAFGNTSVQAFSPFAPTAAYSAATNGGSGYFDGDGDYITVPDNSAFTFGNGDFTIEFWFYATTANSAKWLFSHTSGGNYSPCSVILDSGLVRLYMSANNSSWGVADADTIGSFYQNQWHHVAISREGSTIRHFLDGVLGGSIPTTATLMDATGTFQIAARNGGSTFTGYISGFRVVKGTAVYTATFTPPTAPLTAITNTQLLCNFTNAGIIDSTAKNVLETVGNAQIDTGTKKFGTGSLEFDGTGDSINAPNVPNLSFGSGDFTIEFWMYTSSTAADVISQRPSGNYGPFGIYIGGSQTIEGYVSTTGSSWVFTGSRSFTNNQWTHVALVRNGSTVYIYVDGTRSTGGNVSTSALMSDTSSPLRIGGTVGNGDFNGFIDDLRITKGVARYTANFTPPTKAFPDQ